jgi:hypothetical protein
MNELMKIGNTDIQIKEFQGERVVTFRDIDEIHERPDGTASRNFRQSKERFIEDKDYYRLTAAELKATNFVELNSPNGITLITESGYLMLVKSLTDDLSWEVQRKLVDTYFRVKKDPMLEMMMKDPIMAMRYQQIQMEERIQKAESKTQLIETRLNNIDAIDLHGDDQQKLNAMVRKYAFQKGFLYNRAWADFKQAFNTSYHTNLELLMENYKKKNHIKNLTLPAYLKYADKLQDALRVADKMLNVA